jgi:hypothetical protein
VGGLFAIGFVSFDRSPSVDRCYGRLKIAEIRGRCGQQDTGFKSIKLKRARNNMALTHKTITPSKYNQMARARHLFNKPPLAQGL